MSTTSSTSEDDDYTFGASSHNNLPSTTSSHSHSSNASYSDSSYDFGRSSATHRASGGSIAGGGVGAASTSSVISNATSSMSLTSPVHGISSSASMHPRMPYGNQQTLISSSIGPISPVGGVSVGAFSSARGNGSSSSPVAAGGFGAQSSRDRERGISDGGSSCASDGRGSLSFASRGSASVSTVISVRNSDSVPSGGIGLGVRSRKPPGLTLDLGGGTEGDADVDKVSPTSASERGSGARSRRPPGLTLDLSGASLQTDADADDINSRSATELSTGTVISPMDPRHSNNKKNTSDIEGDGELAKVPSAVKGESHAKNEVNGTSSKSLPGTQAKRKKGKRPNLSLQLSVTSPHGRAHSIKVYEGDEGDVQPGSTDRDENRSNDAAPVTVPLQEGQSRKLRGLYVYCVADVEFTCFYHCSIQQKPCTVFDQYLLTNMLVDGEC